MKEYCRKYLCEDAIPIGAILLFKMWNYAPPHVFDDLQFFKVRNCQVYSAPWTSSKHETAWFTVLKVIAKYTVHLGKKRIFKNTSNYIILFTVHEVTV